MENLEIKKTLRSTMNESEQYFEHIKYMYIHNLLKKSEVKDCVKNVHQFLSSFIKDFMEKNNVDSENVYVKKFNELVNRMKKYLDSLSIFKSKTLHNEQSNSL